MKCSHVERRVATDQVSLDQQPRLRAPEASKTRKEQHGSLLLPRRAVTQTELNQTEAEHYSSRAAHWSSMNLHRKESSR